MGLEKRSLVYYMSLKLKAYVLIYMSCAVKTKYVMYIDSSLAPFVQIVLMIGDCMNRDC